MKVALALFGFLILSYARIATAQVMPYDSLAMDSLITNTGVENSQNVLGLPDTRQATLSSSSILTGMFTTGKHVITFDKGSQIDVYWIRETSDSAAAGIQFMGFDTNLFPTHFGPTDTIVETGPEQQENETTLTVPDTGFNAIQITIAGIPGASIAYVDAVIL
ncbi:MAG: hypothetical protein ACYDBH_25320, partial [Acidobacteriaceae bacterium]